MKTRYKIIIIVIVTAVSLFAISGFMQPNPLWLVYQCQPDFGIPNADALIVHQTIGMTFDQADVVAVGTITDSFPCFRGGQVVTHMTLDVEGYLKNPQDSQKIRLEARGGSIPGVGGTWVEDEIIFERGERALLFLHGSENIIYDISPYSKKLDDNHASGIDLIRGIELGAENNTVTLGLGDAGNISLLLDSFFGYDKKTSVDVSGFSVYNRTTGNSELFEDPTDLEKFGIHIGTLEVVPNANKTLSFSLPIATDKDAKKGRYSVSISAKTQDYTESMEHLPWKISHKQIHVIVEKRN